MNRQKRPYPVVNIGTSFFLLIFIVLCLVTFAVLSLSSSLKDQTYAEKTADRTADYYRANGEAEEKLAQTVQEFLASGKTKDTVSYQVEINDTQTLQVSLELSSKEDLDEGYYRITEWNEVSSGDWDGDTTLPVLGSE